MHGRRAGFPTQAGSFEAFFASFFHRVVPVAEMLYEDSVVGKELPEARVQVRCIAQYKYMHGRCKGIPHNNVVGASEIRAGSYDPGLHWAHKW